MGVILWVLAALLALSTPAGATRGSQRVPKVLTYSASMGSLPPATRDSLAWFDVLVCHDRPETIGYLRSKNPNQRYLWALLPQYVEPAEGDNPWWMPDTLWSIKRLMTVYAWKNDWYMRNVDGSIVTDGTFYLLNWTEHCPVGTFGSAKGLRASEWLASVALPTIALSGRYWDPWSWDSRTAYNGYMFEILADCLGSYYWQNYQYADPDRDGDADGVYSACSVGGTDDPLSVLLRQENEVFYQRLQAAFPPQFVFTINGNWDYIGPWWLTRLSGIKLENWMRESNPEYVDWWDHFYGLTPPWEGGLNHGGGYYWVEQNMDKPAPDSLRGWDLSVIQVHKRTGVPESENQRQVRWGLGTSMLGDGYFCYSLDQRMPLWPPEFDWDFGDPSGDFFRQLFGTDTLMVRRFEKGMVQVNPYTHAVGGVPAEDSRFTFWSGVDDLAATALGQTRARVTWTSPVGNPDAPESFELRYAQAPITLQNWDQAASYAGNPVPADAGEPIAVEINGLNPGMTYFLAVRGSYHGLLETELSNPVNVTTDPAQDTVAPAAIDDLASPGSGQTWIDLTWTATGDDDQTGQAAQQFLRYLRGEAIDSEGDWNRATQAGGLPPPSPPGSEESFRLAGLAAATTYGIAVRARDEAGNLSPLAPPFTARTLDPPPPPDTTPPAAVSDLAGVPDEPGAARLTWTAPGDDGANGRATSYEVRIRADQAIASEGDWAAAGAAPGTPPAPGPAGSEETFLLAELEEGAAYGVAVRARDEAGNLAGLSNPLVVEMGTSEPPPPPPDGVPPSAIGDLVALDLADTSATLFWTAPGDDGVVGTATAFEMGWLVGELIEDEQGWAAATKIIGAPLPDPEPAGTLQSFAWNGLEPNTTYGVALRARDDAGLLGPLGSSIEVHTTVTLPPDDPPADSLPPDPIDDLRLERAEIHRIVLAWTAPADSGGDGTADSYAMRFAPEGVEPDRVWEEGTEVVDLPAPSAPGATDSVAIGSLDADRLYGFLLRSRDATGNLSDDSNLFWARTLSEPPPPPPPPPVPPAAIDDLALASAGPDSARFTWTAPGDDGRLGRAQRYLVRVRTGGTIDSEESWEAALPADTSGLGAPRTGGEAQVWTLRGLEPETSYGLAIRAVDDSSLIGGLSNPLAWTTPARPLEPPGPVRDLASPAQEEHRALVTWLGPLAAVDLAPATSFVLARRLGSAAFEAESDWDSATLEEGSLPGPGAPEETLSFWIEGLESDTAYAVTLRARDEQGRLGTLVPGIVVTTAAADTVIDPPPPPPDLPPAPIDDLHVVGTGSDRALLAWTAVGEDSLAGTAAVYELRIRTGASIETPGDWEAASPYDGALPAPRAAGSPESLQVVGLAPSASYGFALRVRDHAGQISPFTPGVLATTGAPPAELPLPVTDLTGTVAGSETIHLRWSHSRDAGAERGPERYLVGLATIPLVEVLWSIVELHPEPPEPAAAGVAVELSWTGLEPGSRYWVAVRAQDRDGRLSPISNVVSLETRPLDLAPPEPPAHVWIAGNDPDGLLLLAWDPSASPDVAGYHIYGKTGGDPWERLTVEPLPPTTTRWSAPVAHRSFAVSALDFEGNESAPRASAEGALTHVDVRGPFPHPVRSFCRLEIMIPLDRLDERLRVRIFDIEGNEVRVLIDEPAGRPMIELSWDRRDSDGSLAAPGFYLLRVEVGSSATHRRIYLDP